MALIKCSHCGGMISDKATKCPKCGNGVVSQAGNFEIKKPQTPKKEKKIITIDEEKLKKDNWVKMSIAITVCLIVVMAFGVYENMFFHAGFGIYGLISLLVVCVLLLWKGFSAIRYKTNGKSKLALYRLKSKWITVLMWFFGLSGIAALGMDVYQGKEYKELFYAKECTRYSVGIPYLVKWSYYKWETNKNYDLKSVKVDNCKWSEEEEAISAHISSNNVEETQSPLRLTIVHDKMYGDAIILGLNFNLHKDDADKVVVDITVDDDLAFAVKCVYKHPVWYYKNDIWYPLLVYGKQYKTLLTKLKTGKTCSIKIGGVDKTYKFNIEGLEWDEAIGNGTDSEKKQEVAKMDSTKMSETPMKSNPVKKTISDLRRMGLEGPVKELELWIEYFESETEYKQYQFDEKGMLTKSQNELVGYPQGMGGEGVSCTCVYKDGKLVSSVVDADGVISMFNYEYQQVSDTQTDVYRISTENDNKEKATSLYYDNEGNLIRKSVYYDIDNPVIHKYNGDGVMDLALEQNASEQITQKDEYGNWIEIVTEDCKTTRRISYY